MSDVELFPPSSCIIATVHHKTVIVIAMNLSCFKATLWPSGLRRCVKAAVFLAWVRIPPESILLLVLNSQGFCVL